MTTNNTTQASPEPYVPVDSVNSPAAPVLPLPEGTVVSTIQGAEVFTRIDVDYGHLPKP